MKQKRHAAILQLIASREIVTQEELANHLNAMGFQVTQATVSRDIKELKLTKIHGDSGVYKYARSQQQTESADRQVLILSRSVYAVSYAQNIVVVKTHAGMAQAAAAVLDSFALEEIIGSIAGDDTIFCVVADENTAKGLTEQIKSYI